MLLHTILEPITVHNWYCGEITASYAWANSCTIENKSEQNKIRKALKRAGYIAHFYYSILYIEKI